MTASNRRKAFEIRTRSRHLAFPYSEAAPSPSRSDRVREVFVNKKLGGEGFSCALESGREGTVHVDHILEYNKDPRYLADMLLCGLTLEAQRRVRKSALSTREIIRRLGTSPAQFYRLLDQTNYSKSLQQLIALLAVLDCEVDLVVRPRRA